MRKQAATEAEGGQKVKIRGAGGVKNRLFLSYSAVKRCLRLPFHVRSGAVPGPQGGAMRRRKRHIAQHRVMLYRLKP